jgi:carbamoyltransferase
MRIGPRRPRLGAAGFRLALPLLEYYYRQRSIFRSTSRFAVKRFAALRAKLDRGETVYVAGIGAGTHNSGVALVEVTRDGGPKVICNNEEERFSGNKHTTQFPQMAIDALLRTMNGMGLCSERIDAWLGAFDYPAMGATLIRTVLEEAPSSLTMLRRLSATQSLYPLHLGQTASTAQRLGHQLGRSEPVPVIAIPHHDNHAWFSFAASPMARSTGPVVVAVLDGHGDLGAISIYLCDRGRMHRLRSNDSVFDSLGIFYSVISSSQGGWTWLSSEGRYMGATAYGDNSRQTNRFYAPIGQLFSLQPEGRSTSTARSRTGSAMRSMRPTRRTSCVSSANRSR